MTAMATAATLYLLIFSLSSISTYSLDLKNFFHCPSHSTSSGDYCATDIPGIDGSAQKCPSGQDELGISYGKCHELLGKVTSVEKQFQLARADISHNARKIENLESQLKDQQYKIDSLCTELASAWNKLGEAITATVKVLSSASSIKFNGPTKKLDHPDNQPHKWTSHMNSFDDQKHGNLEKPEEPKTTQVESLFVNSLIEQ